jgi:hypothetical protein
MSDLRKVAVCFAPSVVLGDQGPSTMGNIVEQAILHDYLEDTSFPPPHPFTVPLPNNTDWWDVGNQHVYRDLLLTRHPELNERKVRELKTLKVPDISTWKARYLRNGVAATGPAGQRSELYEVKPDTIWGERDGRAKLHGIDDNFRELGLTGYKWGTWYPEPPGAQVVARKEIQFRTYEYVIAGFRYRVERMIRSLRNIGRHVRIDGVVLEVERREAGLLYYMICVKLTLDFNGEDYVAKQVLRRLFEALTTGLKAEEAFRELEFAKSLQPASRARTPPGPRPPPDTQTREAIRAIESEGQFLIRALVLVPELANAIALLGNTLFSRLRGLPGQRFIVCSNEVYFRNEILGPRQQQIARQIAPLQVRPPAIFGSRLAIGGAIVKVEAPILATIHVILKVADDPSTLFSAKEEWTKALRWLEARPAFTLVVGSAVVYGTALVVASGGAAGAAGMYAGGAVGAVEGLGVQAGPGLARSLAGEQLGKAALPAVEGRFAQLPLDVARRISADEADRLISQHLSKLAKREAERIFARQVAAQLQREATEKAVTAGGGPLAAIAMRMAVPMQPAEAGGAPSAVPNQSASPADAPVAMEVGSLFLLPAFDRLTERELPMLCEEFDYTRVSPEAPGPTLGLPQSVGGTPPLPKKLRYLGMLVCE